MTWTQVYVLYGNWAFTSLLAALPIIVLFTLLAGLRVKPHWCAIAGAGTAVFLAVLFFNMPPQLAGMSFLYGLAFGILKVAWIVIPTSGICLRYESFSSADFGPQADEMN